MAELVTTEVATPRVVQGGRGLAWWTQAWALFTLDAGMWVVLCLVLLGTFVLLGLIPGLGSLASTVLTPVFAGSLMIAGRKAESGAALAVSDLFAGFRASLNPLLVLGAVTLVATLAIGGIGTLLGLGAIVGVIAGSATASPGAIMAALSAGIFGLLIVLVLGALVTMALWFAPALVVFRNFQPAAALRTSFTACTRNVGAFLLYGLVYLAAAVIASIPLGLGWLVLIPVLVLTVYTSYQDVFAA